MQNKNERDVVSETEYYAMLYSKADADGDGRISGREGASFLRKSGLSDKDLEKVSLSTRFLIVKVWELSSHGNAFLTQKEFAVAMRLISLAQSGKPMNLDQIHNIHTLPRFNDIPYPNQLPSKMSDQDLQKYDSLFAQADANQDGYVDGNEAKGFFSRAELPYTALAQIWKLCERDSDGKLNKGEFRLAMHLVYWCLQGNSLPNVLPQTLIDQANSSVVQNYNAMGLFIKPDNKAPSPFITSLTTNPSQNSQTFQPPVTQNSQNVTQNYPSTFVQSGTIPVTPMGMGYMLPTQTMTTHTMNPGNTPVNPTMAPYMQTHNMMPNPVMMHPGNTPVNPTMSTTPMAPSTNYQMASYPTATQAQMNPGNTPMNPTMSATPVAPASTNWTNNQYSAPIGNTTAIPQSTVHSQGPTPSQTPAQTQNPPKTATTSPFASSNSPFASSASPFASSNSPFASSNSPFASSASPFASSNSPFASSNSPFSSDTGATSFAAEKPKPKATTTDPFGSTAATNPNEPAWIPAETGHNYDQSKYVYQHSMPGTTFEMRANFTAELGDALNKVKSKQHN